MVNFKAKGKKVQEEDEFDYSDEAEGFDDEDGAEFDDEDIEDDDEEIEDDDDEGFDDDDEDDDEEIEEEEYQEEEEETGRTNADAIKYQLESHQALSKTAVNQLHLLNKFNAFYLKPEFQSFSQSRSNQQISLQLNLLLLMRDMLSFQKTLGEQNQSNVSPASSLLASVNGYLASLVKFYQKANQKTKSSHKINLEQLSKNVSSYTGQNLKDWKETIDKWNTATLPQMNIKLTQSQKSPILLVEESLAKPEKLFKVYQPKPEDLSILAKRSQNPNEYTDSVYEDAQMIHEVTKELLMIGKAFKAEMQEGLLFKNTEEYLRQRLSRKEKVKRDVDHGARKDKRVKFDVHEKLMNFMAPIPNEDIWENRDEFIANLLGQKRATESKKKQTVDADIIDDIQLM
jgi:protein AATF/BFR2